MSIMERIIGSSRWNILLGVLAVIILIGSFSALAYTALIRVQSEIVRINDREYRWDALDEDFDTISIHGIDGIPLTVIIEDSGVEDPPSHDYVLIAGDGYRKTSLAPWESSPGLP